MEAQKHITIVDDDPAIQDAVQMMLERKGYRVTIYSHGGPLLSGHFEHPDLVIMDKQLPGVDGLDVCRYIKQQAATRHIPVLMLSASPQIGPMAMAACADGFLEKPFRMQELRDKVQQMTR